MIVLSLILFSYADSCFVLANARILEYPIVYASNGFTNLTGFSRIEVMQRPGLCPFLNGPQTSKENLKMLEQSLKYQRNDHTELILYKKNLTPLWIVLRVIPIRNDEDVVVLFLITFRDLTAFRQPLKDDFAQSSALGAFAAASDAGSSWGRFARLVFSMVRQKSEAHSYLEEGQTNTGNSAVNEEEPVPNLSSQAIKECASVNPNENTGKICGDKTRRSNPKPPECKSINVKEQNAPTDPKEEDELIVLNQACAPKTKTVQRNMGCKPLQQNREIDINKVERGQNLIQDLEVDDNVKRLSVLKKLNKVKLNKESIPVSLVRSSSSLKRYTTAKVPNVNGDSEELSSSHWSVNEPVPRYRPEPPCPPKHVLLHYSVFRILWDWTILLLTGYTAVIVPLRVAVIPRPAWISAVSETISTKNVKYDNWFQPSVPESLAIADAIIDIIFGVDIVLNFHTSFVGAGGEVVADPPVIRMNYLSGWFTLDLISCLPYEILKYCWPVSNQEVYYLMDALRIVRLLRIGRAARRIDQYLEYVSTLLLLMILCFFLLAHWFACAWYAVGVSDLENRIQYGWIPRAYNDSLNPQNWQEFTQFEFFQPNSTTKSLFYQNFVSKYYSKINATSISYHAVTTPKPGRIHANPFPLQNYKDKWSAYLTALYFSLSLLTTIGFGNVAAFTESEKILSICCMLIGALVYATIFGNVTTIVQQMYATRTRYNEMMKGVKDFLKIHEVPQELGERVIDYITSSWSVTKGIDTVKVLNYCPKDMQADISVHLNRCVFNSHAAFRLASDGCRRSLAVNFQTLHTAPGDLICHQGESVDQLCFIASGTLEVLQDDEVIAILGKGDVFGDPSWRNTASVPSAASVRALTYCTLHTIRLDRLRSVLNFYHAFANSFTRNLELTYNLCNRVIFRKLSDVKREMELSMRRNREPPLSSLPAGHPVRKLISRLRRSSQAVDLSSRQCMSTIMSCETSLDGSDFENSSISGSGITAPTDHRSSICPANKPQTQSFDNEVNPATLSHPSSPKQTSPIHTQKTGPADTVPQANDTSTPLSSQSKPSFTIGRTSGPQTNPARKWARLISKAAQPTLQNLNEEPNEDSSRIASASVFSKTMKTASVPTTNPPTSKEASEKQMTILENEQPEKLEATGSKDLASLELNLQKLLHEIHLQIKNQLNDITKRIDGLEVQLNEVKNIVSGEDPKPKRRESNMGMSQVSRPAASGWAKLRNQTDRQN